MDLKLFTVDSTNGKCNPELQWLEQKLRNALSKVTDEYTKDCIDNNIEVCSSEGVFWGVAFQCLTESRIKNVCEKRKSQ